MSRLLDINGIDVSYGNAPILRGVSMHVKDGEIVGVVGESGSGKSTTIYATLGILGNGGKVTAGSIHYDGRDLLALSQEDLRKMRGEEMSLVAQNPMTSFHPIRKINKQLKELVACHSGMTYAEAEEHMCEIMAKMNLKDGKRLLNSYAFELSGGMCQRVSIAMALVLSPKLLLADEPTSALDVTVQKQVVEEMRKLRDEYGNSTLIVSHNMGVISYISDRVYVMFAGRVMEYGEKGAVIKRPMHPYTKNLIAAVPTMNAPMPTGVRPTGFDRTVPGCVFYQSCPCRQQVCALSDPEPVETESGHFVKCHCIREGKL